AGPRHALEWVKRLAALPRSRFRDRQSIATAEPYFIRARNLQAFRWGGEAFTCVHCAVLSLTSKIADLAVQAMSTRAGVIGIPPAPETNRAEEWEAAYVRLAQTHGVLDGQRQAGKQWAAFCERYRRQAGEVVWDDRTANNLRTELLMEASAAAALLPGGE